MAGGSGELLVLKSADDVLCIRRYAKFLFLDPVAFLFMLGLVDGRGHGEKIF